MIASHHIDLERMRIGVGVLCMTEHMVKHNQNRDGIRLHHKNVSESDYKSHQKNATTIAMRDVRTSKTANLHKTSYVRSITAYALKEVRLNRSMDVVHVQRSRSKKVAPVCRQKLAPNSSAGFAHISRTTHLREASNVRSICTQIG